MNPRDIKNNIDGLASNKITERKKCADNLRDAFNNPTVIKYLNDEDATVNWNYLFERVHYYLQKEAEKLNDDEVKKRSLHLISTQKSASSSLFISVVNKANNKDFRLPLAKLMNSILQGFENVNTRKYYSDAYLQVLCDNVLSDPAYRSELTLRQWRELFLLLKRLYRNDGASKTKIIANVYLVVKWGLFHKPLLVHLREEYDYIKQITLDLKPLMPKSLMEDTLRLSIVFCSELGKAYRVSSCKFGEEVINTIIDLYEHRYEDYGKRKSLIFEFLLLQVRLHHPLGVFEGEFCSYAHDWTEWKGQLKSLYSIMCYEVDLILRHKAPRLGFPQQALWPNYLALMVEVTRQILHLDIQNVSHVMWTNTSSLFLSSSHVKKQKLDVGLPFIISVIQSGENWCWMSILCELLTIYPETIESEDYTTLLQVLASLQVECKDPIIRHYLYNLLTTMVNVQQHIGEFVDLSVVDPLWVKIWETTLRVVGLNQNEDVTHKLLQNMLKYKKSSRLSALLQIYCSGVLNQSVHSIQTLNDLCSTLTLPEHITLGNDTELTRLQLIKWLLALNTDKTINTAYFTEDITCRVLVSLVLKTWPEAPVRNDPIPSDRQYNDIEQLYILTSLGKLDIESTPNIPPVEEPKTFFEHSETLKKFCDIVVDINSKLIAAVIDKDEDVVDVVNHVVLILNALSRLIDIGLLSLSDTIDIKNLIKNTYDNIYKFVSSVRDEQVIIVVFKLLERLHRVELCEAMCIVLRDSMTDNLMKYIFTKLNTTTVGANIDEMDDDMQDANSFGNHLTPEATILSANHSLDVASLNNAQLVRICAMRFFTAYCCVPSANAMFPVQTQIVKSLSAIKYDWEDVVSFHMNTALLNALNACKKKALSQDILTVFIKLLEELLNNWYTNPKAAVMLLQTLNDFYDHVDACDATSTKSSAVLFLKPLYDDRGTLSPDMSIALIKCIGRLLKLDPSGDWSKLPNHDKVSDLITDFFSSDNHEIRMCAIKNVLSIFSTYCGSKFKEIVPIQKKLFEDICEQVVKLFSVAGELNEELVIDETVNRTACTLHVLASIIVVSPMWRKPALFAMIKLLNAAKLNIGSVQKTLMLVGECLNTKNVLGFLELNLNYLMSQWNKEGHSFSNFPYQLFDCDSDTEFFIRYINTVIPFMLQRDSFDQLKAVCVTIKKPPSQVIEDAYSKIMPYYLPIIALNESVDNDISKTLHVQLEKLLSAEKIQSLLSVNFGDVFIELLHHFFDNEHFKQQFSISHMLPEPDPPIFKHQVLMALLKYIEDTLSTSQPFTSRLFTADPKKLEYILLNLTLDLYRIPTVEEKLKALHRYTIMVDYIVPHLRQQNNVKVFLVRSITYTFVNIIKLYNTESLLSLAACRYLRTFCKKCLAHCPDVLEKFLIFVVSELVPIAKCTLPIGNECIALLNVLLVDHSKNLYTVIEKLDPFPKTEKFDQVREVLVKIKYGNEMYSLEQEIIHFLELGNLIDNGCRAEGLEHLRLLLSDKKEELFGIYSKLCKLRGFAEDCEESILHRLICMLVKLTSSTDSMTRIEAARCLGELGPIDLTTMILKPDNLCFDGALHPTQLTLARVLYLLSKYLVDPDSQVIKSSSDALYVILSCSTATTILNAAAKYSVCGVINREYIVPFVIGNRVTSTSDTSVAVGDFCNAIDDYNLWCPNSKCSHADWITTLVCKLLEMFPEKSVFRSLIPVCKTKVEFSEELFPLLVYLVLYNNSAKCTSVLSKQIQYFFASHWNFVGNASLATNNEMVAFNRASVKCMLNVVHYIRLIKCSEKREKCGDPELNYLHIAQGAQYCSAHFTSILYAELWCYHQLGEESSVNENKLPLLDSICENEKQVTPALLNILREGYKKVGDIDALYGCGVSYLMDSKSQIELYKHLGRWDKVTLHYDIELSHGSKRTTRDMLNALKNNSWNYLASNFSGSSEFGYECLWRLSNWDHNDRTVENTTNELVYEKHQYFALKSLHEMDFINVNQSVMLARNSVIESLAHASLESSKNLYKALTQLQSLQEIENFRDAFTDSTVSELIQKLKQHNALNKNEFTFLEPLIAQRITILGDVVARQEDMRTHYIDMHLDLAGRARSEGVPHIAQRALTELSYIDDISQDVKGRIILEQAQLSWLEDNTTGRVLLRNFLHHYATINPKLYATGLKLYGSWMVETRSENPSTIIDNYFKKSLEILNSLKSKDDIIERCKTVDALARFCDLQYKQIASYTDSSEFQSKIKMIEKFRTMGTKIREQLRTKMSDSDLQDNKRAIALYEKQAIIDDNEVQNSLDEQEKYLILAVKYYLMILEQSDDYNLTTFRILSLCLANKNKGALLQILKESLPKIPTYKFMPLLPQLIPHISQDKEEKFECIISSLLERCAIDHPHHTLPVIMGLANSFKDRDKSKADISDSVENRVQSAKNLMAKLLKNRQLTDIINNMEKLSTALISLAYLEVNEQRDRSITIPRREPIKSIREFQNVLLPTLHLEVRRNCNYDNITGIFEFGSSFQYVGGINAPKKIECRGTDGKSRPQLVKGKDDLRQDAVMQQVFTILNTLLARNKQTEKLLIRTYKVVPLSKRSGILEWCENTEPIGNYLLKAHPQYHPNDWTATFCRSKLKTSADDAKEKLKKYMDVCRHFRPVFHMFFIDSYPQPAIWFERRRAYVHSVATSSMIGYVLGLGDRHVQNILIDKKTAEVIHIDFGIAFEQGRVLPTPETVPFRLTRDIEAGMGVCGIEGVFRRTCEKTMVVLRQNAETVLTILDVLLYDPLYVWTISPAEAYSRQKDDDVELRFSEDQLPLNITAERALSRLKQKLQGTENGGVCSVEGQVEQLIQQARDPANLCKLYNGWQAYL